MSSFYGFLKFFISNLILIWLVVKMNLFIGSPNKLELLSCLFLPQSNRVSKFERTAIILIWIWNVIESKCLKCLKKPERKYFRHYVFGLINVSYWEERTFSAHLFQEKYFTVQFCFHFQMSNSKNLFKSIFNAFTYYYYISRWIFPFEVNVATV